MLRYFTENDNDQPQSKWSVSECFMLWGPWTYVLNSAPVQKIMRYFNGKMKLTRSQGITTVISIYPQGTAGICATFHDNPSNRILHTKAKISTLWLLQGKSQGITTVSFLFVTENTVENVMEPYPIVVEIFQSAPKRWTNHHSET